MSNVTGSSYAPEWAVSAARQNQRDFALLAQEGLSLARFLGGLFATLAVGAAVIGVLAPRTAIPGSRGGNEA